MAHKALLSPAHFVVVDSLPLSNPKHLVSMCRRCLILHEHALYVMRRSSVALACSNIECLLQIILKKDGYANQPDARRAEESEELLAPMDEPLSSNTIPELASMSQVLAPNSIHAEMQSISLHSPRSPAADQDWGVHSAVDENSDPNQAAHHSRLHGSSLEMQPLQKKKSAPSEHQVQSSCSIWDT